MSTPLFSPSAPNPIQVAAIKKSVLDSLTRRLSDDAARTLAYIDAANRRGIASIWNNPLHTPAEALAALGSKAYTLIAGSSATSDYLAAQYALAGGVPHSDGSVSAYVVPTIPEGIVLNFHEDGTVTIA